jgi:AraC family transcriptional regulator
MPTPRDEYLARIHRVQDHVERHLGEELRLEDLARVACFSPFHFHRIYVALTGETLRAFVQRLRLERAASQLSYDAEKSITEIALDAGFGGPDTFARAFRAAYGVTASEYRKNRQALRKAGQERADAATYGAAADAAPDPPVPAIGGSEPVVETKARKAAESAKVEELPAFTVAYVRHVGPYAGDAGLFGRLFGQLGGWAGPRGLIRPDTRWLSIYHDDPGVTAPEKLRLSVCLTVPPGTTGEREVSVMELPGGKNVVARFAIIDGKDYGGAWSWLMGDWLPSSGYQPDDRPCYEIMLSQPGDPLQQIEIVQPVKPL